MKGNFVKLACKVAFGNILKLVIVFQICRNNTQKNPHFNEFTVTEETNYVDHLEFERKQGCCHTKDLDTSWFDDWVPNKVTEYVASNFTCSNCPFSMTGTCMLYDELNCCKIQGCSMFDAKNGWPALDGTCKYFDFGDVSSIFLDGFITAQHSGSYKCFIFFPKHF